MEIKELSFRGVPYKIAYLERFPQDSSWFSFEDEVHVRERDWNIRPGDVVLDIGSAFGSYALTALASGASMVHCWNPEREENELFLRSLQENGWTDRVALHEHGLHSGTGWLEWRSQTVSAEELPGTFRVVALDDLDLGLGRVDWMKVDVEGAEVETIRGAERTIRRFQPVLHVENHQFKDQSIQGRVAELVTSMGYEHVGTHPHHGVTHSLFRPMA